MKRGARRALVLIVGCAVLSSCNPGLISNQAEAYTAAETIVAAITPIVNENFSVDLFAASKAYYTGYTQPDGGTIQFIYQSDPMWESAFDPITEHPTNVTFLTTFTDFLVVFDEYEVTVNGTVTVNVVSYDEAGDRLFIFTVWGDELSIASDNLDDTVSMDFRAYVDIDLSQDAALVDATVTGSLEGVIAGVEMDVADWFFTFSYLYPYPEAM
jgi:hypothetical protein